MRSYMSSYQFDTDEAVQYGVDEAIVLHNIKFWTIKNVANKKHFYDDHWWTYNSCKAFEEIFPFWNQYKIRRILKSLVSQKAIIEGNYNKAGYDRTKWYAISAKSILQKCNIHLADLQNGTGESAKPIPDSKPDTKTDNNTYTDAVASESLVESKETEPIKDNGERIANTPTENAIAKEVFDYYNEKRGNMSKAVAMTNQRKSAIKARLKEYGEEAVKGAIDMAAESDFLQGRTDCAFSCGIDWLMGPKNFIKVVEGNYKNKVKAGGVTRTINTDLI